MFHGNVCDQYVEAKIADKLKLHWWKATSKGITDNVQKITFNSIEDRTCTKLETEKTQHMILHSHRKNATCDLGDRQGLSTVTQAEDRIRSTHANTMNFSMAYRMMKESQASSSNRASMPSLNVGRQEAAAGDNKRALEDNNEEPQSHSQKISSASRAEEITNWNPEYRAWSWSGSWSWAP